MLMLRNAGSHRIVDNILQGVEIFLEAGLAQCRCFPLFNQEPLVVANLVQERGYEIIRWFFRDRGFLAIAHCTDC